MNKIVVVLFSLCLLVAYKEQKKQPVANPVNLPVNGKDNHLPPLENGSNQYKDVDVSPLDMSYFPVDYPKLKTNDSTIAPPLARVIYSRPHLQGRHIFHEVLSYGEPWRMGANEATELQLFTNASIQGKPIRAGRYTLYCIPQQKEWTIVFNSNTDSWGLQQLHSKDVASFTIPVEEKNQSLEYYTMLFEKAAKGANLMMAWDNVELRLPILFQ